MNAEPSQTTHDLHTTSPSAERTNLRWRSFSLRTFLLVITAVTVCLVLVTKPARDRRAAVLEIDRLHGGYGINLEGPKWLHDHVRENKWFYNLGRVSLGPVCDGYDPNNPFDDDQLRDVIPHLNRFSQFTTLHLSGAPITDAGMLHLQKLNNLEVLYIDRTQLSDAGLENLMTIKTLRTLDVRGTAVTPDGVAEFQAAQPACEVLWNQRLGNTK